MTPDLKQFLAKATDLADLPPIERARALRPLVNEAKAVFSSAADAAIVEALNSLSASELARQLGVTPPAINKATNRHRERALTGSTE